MILSTFTYPTTGQTIRTALIDDAPWFDATDACHALGMDLTKGVFKWLRRLTADEKRLATRKEHPHLFCGSRAPTRTLISEPGLYRFIQSSRLPEAKAFDRWVRHEVLPAIRKDGAYVAGEEKVRTGEMSEDELILRAMQAQNRKVERLIAEKAAAQEEARVLAAENIALEGSVAEMRPKVAEHDQYMDSDGTHVLSDAARLLGIPPRKMMDWLLNQGVLYRRGSRGKLVALQPFINAGYFVQKAGAAPNGYAFMSTFVTPSGLSFLARKWARRTPATGPSARSAQSRCALS